MDSHALGVPSEIVAHYEAYDEAARLETGIGLLERDRTHELMFLSEGFSEVPSAAPAHSSQIIMRKHL